jgi:hypothetical protein
MLLIFTVVYAILQKSKLLGGTKNIDAIISLVISFFAVGNPQISGFFLPLFSNVALGIIIMLSMILFAGLFLKQSYGGEWRTVGVIIGVVVFIWMLSRAANIYSAYSGGEFTFLSSSWWLNNASWIILLFLIGIVILVIVSSGEKKTKFKFLEVPSGQD